LYVAHANALADSLVTTTPYVKILHI